MSRFLVSGSFFLFFLIDAVIVNSENMIPFCNQTPYPGICNSLISDSHLFNHEQTHLGFRDLALRVTMDRAHRAHRLASAAMKMGSFRGKPALQDCLELYEDTIAKLNQTMRPSVSFEDAQTWLSAAISNQETCRTGLVELNARTLLGFASNNVSKMLSNSLAINKLAKLPFSGRKLFSGGFPMWLSGSDRKLLAMSGFPRRAHVVVAKDGSGHYRSINEGVAAAEKLRSGSERFVIYVKAGVYRENVEIKKNMKNLMFVGDGIDVTVVYGNKNVQDGSTTFRSATFAVSGNGFIAKDMTFQNTAGPQKHQAVALRSSADFSVFYSCSFKGYQDTLYVHSQRQFYRKCDIYGTVDFIFGDAAAVLQNCNIYVRKPMTGQKNTVTAQGRSDPNENTGIAIHNSRVTAASDLKPVQSSFQTYLGRPWKQYSRTVFMKTVLDGLIDPAGWLEWNGDFALSTLYYGEYMNSGAGADTIGRVKWPGHHLITSGTEAGEFTAGKFLSGYSWLPSTGVPYTFWL